MASQSKSTFFNISASSLTSKWVSDVVSKLDSCQNIIITRQVTRATQSNSLSRNKIMNFQTEKRYKTIRHC